MSAVSSSPIPAVLAKLGPLNPDDMVDLRFLEAVPDPRSRRGRWYSLPSILLVCAAAAISGARTLDELAEWGARADAGLLAALGVRRHLLRRRHAPSKSLVGRVLERLDADAPDAAVGAWLAHRHTAAAPGRRRVIAVDGKALRGSARLSRAPPAPAVRRHPRPPGHPRPAEVGSKTNETRHFQPLLAPLDLDEDVATFDALHSVKANVAWLVETKKAHYVAVIKPNQPNAWAQLDGLDWHAVAIQHTASNKGHGRRESRSVKTLAIADNLGGIAFPHAKLAARVHRRRKATGRKETRKTLHTVTSLDTHRAKPAELASHLRGHWIVEAHHHIRDRTFAEDASTVHTGNAPRVMATLRNLAIGALKALGATNIAKTTRAIHDQPKKPSPSWASPTSPTSTELDQALAAGPTADTAPVLSLTSMAPSAVTRSAGPAMTRSAVISNVFTGGGGLLVPAASRRSVPRALLRELLLLATDVVDRAEDRPAGPEGAGGAEAVGVRVLLGLLRGVLGGAHDRVARGVLVVEAVERAALVLGLVEDHADAPEGVVHLLVARGRRRARVGGAAGLADAGPVPAPVDAFGAGVFRDQLPHPGVGPGEGVLAAVVLLLQPVEALLIEAAAEVGLQAREDGDPPGQVPGRHDEQRDDQDPARRAPVGHQVGEVRTCR